MLEMGTRETHFPISSINDRLVGTREARFPREERTEKREERREKREERREKATTQTPSTHSPRNLATGHRIPRTKTKLGGCQIGKAYLPR